MSEIFRQGDVLIVRCDSVEPGIEVKRDGGRVVLAYGESTGHAHAIKSRGARLYERAPTEDRTNVGDDVWARAERILVVFAKAGVELRHEEHAPIHLPEGKYRVIGQREYSPEEIRRVVD
jgi:hypothetical protein